MAYRVGFASIDGSYVDQHFGSARYWQVFDIAEQATFVETRKTAAKCGGHCEGGFDHILGVLQDCDALFVARIGESAAAYMILHGKRVFEAAGEVEEIIAQLIEQDLLQEEEG